MINYNKNKLINTCLERYYETFARMLDTADYVPEKYNDKILKYIFKNMRRQFGKIDKEDKAFQRQLLETQRKKEKEIEKQKTLWEEKIKRRPAIAARRKGKDKRQITIKWQTEKSFSTLHL